MRFKLDENPGMSGKEQLEADGHDVMTVSEQGLSGASDQRLFEIVREEDRALITLDRGFGEVLRFPPGSTTGIVVLVCPGRLTARAIHSRLVELISGLRREPLDGSLWVVEPGRVRIHKYPSGE